MRIKTLTGLVVAGAASVGALALAGAAYAGTEPEPVVQIVTDECPDAGSDADSGRARGADRGVPGGSL